MCAGLSIVDSSGQVIDVEIVAYDSDEEITWGMKTDIVERHFSDIGALIAPITNRRG
jgi:hypothetical protein